MDKHHKVLHNPPIKSQNAINYKPFHNSPLNKSSRLASSIINKKDNEDIKSNDKISFYDSTIAHFVIFFIGSYFKMLFSLIILFIKSIRKNNSKTSFNDSNNNNNNVNTTSIISNNITTSVISSNTISTTDIHKDNAIICKSTIEATNISDNNSTMNITNSTVNNASTSCNTSASFTNNSNNGNHGLSIERIMWSIYETCITLCNINFLWNYIQYNSIEYLEINIVLFLYIILLITIKYSLDENKRQIDMLSLIDVIDNEFTFESALDDLDNNILKKDLFYFNIPTFERKNYMQYYKSLNISDQHLDQYLLSKRTLQHQILAQLKNCTQGELLGYYILKDAENKYESKKFETNDIPLIIMITRIVMIILYRLYMNSNLIICIVKGDDYTFYEVINFIITSLILILSPYPIIRIILTVFDLETQKTKFKILADYVSINKKYNDAFLINICCSNTLGTWMKVFIGLSKSSCIKSTYIDKRFTLIYCLYTIILFMIGVSQQLIQNHNHYHDHDHENANDHHYHQEEYLYGFIIIELLTSLCCISVRWYNCILRNKIVTKAMQQFESLSDYLSFYGSTVRQIIEIGHGKLIGKINVFFTNCLESLDIPSDQKVEHLFKHISILGLMIRRLRQFVDKENTYSPIGFLHRPAVNYILFAGVVISHILGILVFARHLLKIVTSD